MSQECIAYHDLSLSQHHAPGIMKGDAVRVDDLLSMQSSLNKDLFSDNNFLRTIGEVDFDPLCQRKTSLWEKVVRTMVFSVSRQIASRDEIKRGRQIIEALPKGFKRNIDRDFIIRYLPYILVGLNTHLDQRFVNESNAVEDVCAFITSTYDRYHALSTSFLCAHREATEVRPNSLVDDLVLNKAQRAINLQHAIFANSLIESASITWYQQPATQMASSNMFPEMFLSYLDSGRVPDMLLQLDKHFTQMEELIVSESSNDLIHNLKPLDAYNAVYEAFLVDQFGPDWRDRGIAEPANMQANTWREIQDYVASSALPSVERFTPFFLQSKNGKLLHTEAVQRNIARANELDDKYCLSNGLSIADTTQRAIDWFDLNMNISAETKAKFEVLFYYFWGVTSRSNNSVAFGIDRDFDDYQVGGWRLGYKHNEQDGNKNNSRGVPIVYARRNPAEIEGSTLRDISFRQFWRNS